MLFRQYEEPICSYLARLTGDPDRAEEIVGETLVRVSRSWKSFRGEARFRTWLYRIVINVFRDGVRSASDEPLLEGVPPVGAGQPMGGQFFPLLLDPGEDAGP